MAKRCHECGGKLRSERLHRYVDKLLIPGGPTVVLINGVDQFTCEKCGEKSIRIPNPDGLIAAVAMARIARAEKLTGTEIRFLRKALEMTARQFAAALLVDHTTVSKWENGRKEISARSEKLLRMFVFAKLEKRAPWKSIDAEVVATMKRASAPRVAKQIKIERRRTGDQWHPESAVA